MTDVKNKKSGIGRVLGFIFMKFIPALIILVLIAYTTILTLSVREKVNHWQSASGENGDHTTLSQDEWQLIRDKAFLNARLSMAANDSIGMTINLQDSLVQLEVKGVVLKQIHFEEAEVSRFFKAFKPGPYVKTFSKPFKITDIGGTIVKEPITIKKAPKDSIEAAKNITKVDTTKVEFVEWHVELNHAFLISLVQSDHELGKVDKTTWQYRLNRHYNTLNGFVKAVKQYQKPAYIPAITIFIPKNEAKSFYRGLSRKGGVVIRL